jgi:hypothetical protein
MITLMKLQDYVRLLPLIIFALAVSTEVMAKKESQKKLQTKNSVEKSAHQTLTPKQQMAAHTEDLRELMLQLYLANPQELAKSTQVGPREMTEWVFDGKANWKFDTILGKQGKEAIALIFEPSYQGDVVLPLVVGLESLLFTAYGASNEFDIPLEINKLKLSATFCEVQSLNHQLVKIENRQTEKVINKILENKEIQALLINTLIKVSERLANNAGVNRECD